MDCGGDKTDGDGVMRAEQQRDAAGAPAVTGSLVRQLDSSNNDDDDDYLYYTEASPAAN